MLKKLNLCRVDTKVPTMLYKVLLVGDAHVGKSALAHLMRTGDFLSDYFPTIGVKTTLVEFGNQESWIPIELYEFGGIEKHEDIREEHYKDAHAVIVMYDLSTAKGLYNAKFWLEDSKIPTILVGNKMELINGVQRKSPEFEISVKEKKNVKALFQHLRKILEGKQL